VPVLTAGEEEGRPFLAMEYVDGPSLAFVLESLSSGGEKKTASEIVATLFDEQHEIPVADTSGLENAVIPIRMASMSMMPPHQHSDRRDPDFESSRGTFPEYQRDPETHLEQGSVRIDRPYYLWVGETMSAVCGGVAALHAAGIVHRDIKPANVIVDRSGSPRIVDLGLARSESDPSVTTPGDFVGTPAYSSPEQAAGALHDVGPESDVYSIGVTLFELLTLTRPTQADTPLEYLAKIRKGQVRFVRQVAPDVPWELEAIVDKCLQLKPQSRYADADGVQRDLQAYLELGQLSAKRATTVRRAARAIRRRPGLASAIAATFTTVCLLCLLGINSWEKRQRDLAVATEKKFQTAIKQGDALAYEVFVGMFPRWDRDALKQRTLEAIREYDTALSIKRDALWPLVQRGRLKLLLEDNHSASVDFRKAKELEPSFVSIQRFLNLSTISPAPRKSARRAPAHPHDLYWSARIAYWHDNDFDLADKYFSDAIELAPDLYWARVERYQPLALSHLPTFERLKTARADLEIANKLRPDVPFAQEHALSIRIDDSPIATTQREIERLVATFGQSRARRHLLVTLKLQSGDFEGVFPLLKGDRQLDLAPGAPTTWLAALIGLQRWEEAQKEARAVLARHPTSTMGHFYLLKSLQQLDKAAATEYARQLSDQPLEDALLATAVLDHFFVSANDSDARAFRRNYLAKAAPPLANDAGPVGHRTDWVNHTPGVMLGRADAVSPTALRENKRDLFAMMYAQVAVHKTAIGQSLSPAKQAQDKFANWLDQGDLSYTKLTVAAIARLRSHISAGELIRNPSLYAKSNKPVTPWLPVRNPTSMVLEYNRRGMVYAQRLQTKKALAYGRISDLVTDTKGNTGDSLAENSISAMLESSGLTDELAIRARAHEITGNTVTPEEFSALARMTKFEDSPEAAITVLDKAVAKYPYHMRFAVERMTEYFKIGRLKEAADEVIRFSELVNKINSMPRRSSFTTPESKSRLQVWSPPENRTRFFEFFSKAYATSRRIGDNASTTALGLTLSQMHTVSQARRALIAFEIAALCTSVDLLDLQRAARLAASWIRTSGPRQPQAIRPGADRLSAVVHQLIQTNVLYLGIKAAWDVQDYESLFSLVQDMERLCSLDPTRQLHPLGLRFFVQTTANGTDGAEKWLERMFPDRHNVSLGGRSLLYASKAWHSGLKGDVAVSRRHLARAGVFNLLAAAKGDDNIMPLLGFAGPFLDISDINLGVRWSLMTSTARIKHVDDVDILSASVRSARSLPPHRRALFDSVFGSTERQRIRALLRVVSPDPAANEQCVARYFGTRPFGLAFKVNTPSQLHRLNVQNYQNIADACYVLTRTRHHLSGTDAAGALRDALELVAPLASKTTQPVEECCLAAILCFYKRDYRTADMWVGKCIEKDNDWALPLELRGWIARYSNKLPLAVESFQIAAKQNAWNRGWLFALAARVSIQIGTPASIRVAERHCDSALASDSTNPLAHAIRSEARQALGKYPMAVSGALDTLSASGFCVQRLNDAAWLQATCPTEQGRNARLALRLARKACEQTNWKNPLFIDTLAAAYAEGGQFKEAVLWQEKAVADDIRSPELLAEMEQRLQLYRDKKPYRMERVTVPEQKSQK
jgi:serine/threonine protein kinase